MTVHELRFRLSSREFNNWLIFYEDYPAEWEMSERIEIMLARFASGFFKGKPEDHMLLSARERERINRKDFMESIKGLALPEE